MNKQVLHKNSKRLLSTLLLFLFLNIYSQQISVVNKNKFDIEVSYNYSKFKLNAGESKSISEKEINNINIEYDNGKDLINKYIPIFLNLNESLTIFLADKSIEFKGDKAVLEDLIVNKQHFILYKNIVKYQDIYYKMNNNSELINFSEIVLIDYLNKIKKLNTEPLSIDNGRYKQIEKYVINEWVASLFMVFTGTKALDIKSKELVLYYYNKYIKKGFEDCEYREQYNILIELAKYINQLKINLPKYPIVENSDNDAINQYLPKRCQKYYFVYNYRYYNQTNSPKKDYYKKILKEKFNN